MKKFIIAALMLPLCFAVQAQSTSDKIPFSSKIVKGTLPNGLTYYIQKNQEPKDRADFYIIRNVGAIVENDDQNGLAHFLEHMAFNGTKNFPEKGIINMLERHGVDFGRSINAYTSRNETVYTLFNIPTGNQLLVDSCLLVLHDWSRYVTLADTEIDAERGVICEEWRQRQSSQSRLSQQLFPVLFKDSQYAVRDVIGDTNIILNFKYETLRNFYNKWYRPNLEAIAIVGDVDVKVVEEKIKAMFSAIPNPENAEPLPFTEVPSHGEPYFVVAKDKEATMTNISITRVFPGATPEYKELFGYLREGVLTQLFNEMSGSRMEIESQKPDAAFLNISIYKGGFVRGYDSYNMVVIPREGVQEQLKAMKALITLNQQIVRYGFTESELKAAKANMLASLESQLKEEAKTSNGSYMQEILSGFLTNEPLMDFKVYYNYVKSVLNDVTIDDIKTLANEWNGQGSITFAVTGPTNGEYITAPMAFALAESVISAKDIAPYESNEVDGDLIDAELSTAKIKKEVHNKKIDAVKWTLDNGATVIYKRADYEKDNVSMNGVSNGGYDRYDIDMIPAAQNVSSCVSQYGLGKFSKTDLDRKLAGVNARTGISIGSTTESISGSSSPKDLETMFQLAYLRFEEPRFDAMVHQTIVQKNQAMLLNMKNNPQRAIQDSLSLIFADYNPRMILWGQEALDKMTLDRIEKIYRDRFHNAKDFTFFVVGNTSEDSVKMYAEKYLGSIKSEGKRDKYINAKIQGPKNNITRVIEIPMTNQKSTVIVNIFRKMKLNRTNGYKNYILGQVLSTKYMEEIREKEGGTYGVRVSAGSSSTPKGYSQNMTFDCDPERAEYLKKLIYTNLDSVAINGPKQNELDKIVKTMKLSREQSKEHNSFVMNSVYNYYMNGFDSKDSKYFEEIWDKITVKDIQKFAAKLTKDPRVIDLIFTPAKAAK